MIVRGLDHEPVFQHSARRGGLSTAVEKAVPEHILQSEHAQGASARRCVKLGSPALHYKTWAAFGL